jgi:ferredoxin--NADP+ reductase
MKTFGEYSRVPKLDARVLQRIEITPELMILRIAPVGWRLPAFTAGQFAVLGLPGSSPRHTLANGEVPTPDPDKLIRRAYSIASSPEDRQYLEFYITLVRSGMLTPRLWALEKGDPVWLARKNSGLFTLDDVPAGAHIVLIATGTGLAPYMSMLRGFLLRESIREVAVLHGARHSWDLGYRSELQTLQRLFPNFVYAPTVSRPEEESIPWAGEIGYVQELWQRESLAKLLHFQPDPATTHIFLCGNPKMIEQATTILEAEGFCEHTAHQPGEIHVEKYW